MDAASSARDGGAGDENKPQHVDSRFQAVAGLKCVRREIVYHVGL